MADLRLITILPPQTVSGIQQPQVTGNSTAQGSLGSLQPGSIISGFIINRDSGGNPVLRTDSGDITFASNFFLKIGSEITIRIEHIAGSNSAHILTVNGQPPEIAVLQSGFAPDPEIIVSDNLKPSVQQGTQQPSSSSGATAVQSSQQNPTINIKGTIISPAPMQNAAQSQNTQLQANTAQPHLPVGSQLSLKVISLTQPAAAQPLQGQSQAAIPASIPQKGGPEIIVKTTANPEQFPSAISNSPATGSNIQTPTTTPYAAYARTNAATPSSIPITESATQPTQAVPSMPVNTSQISATVISNDPNGEAIVNTPLGIIRLQAGTQLPIGSNVNFEISEIKTPEMIQNSANIIPSVNIARIPAAITELARNPGALNNIFTLLSGLGTDGAQDFIARGIPTIGQQLTTGNTAYNSEAASPHNLISSIFNYAAAVGNGDFRQWLGKANVKWLEDNGHDDLLKKAEGEFSSIARQFTDAPARSWQSLFFPIAISGELQQVRLFVKRDRKQKNSDGITSPEEDTRFVVEMDLTQLGEMQMDGFVRNKNNNIQFDLIIRSNIALSEEIQKDILAIYNNVGELTGYKGSLAFQAVKEFPVNPMEEIISGDHEGVVA